MSAYMGQVTSTAHLPERFARWCAGRGWRLRDHQAGMIAAAQARNHALLIAATGAGGDADLADDLGEHIAALRVDGILACFDGRAASHGDRGLVLERGELLNCQRGTPARR